MTHRSYPLGNTGIEHERLSRQAAVLAPFTERVFRNAGIGSGQRVLDLGSGAGDVAMLLSSIVGPAGEVIGIERSSQSIACARERVQEAGLRNVSFVEADVGEIPAKSSFDAAVGRFILEFVSDPVAIVRSTAQRVTSGGALVFLEPSWKTALIFSEHLPLLFQSVTIAHETFVRAGADTEVGLKLSRVFQEAGLPLPKLEMNSAIRGAGETGHWICDLLYSLQPQMRSLGISIEALGDLETLPKRIEEEIETSKAIVPLGSLVAAWCTK